MAIEIAELGVKITEETLETAEQLEVNVVRWQSPTLIMSFHNTNKKTRDSLTNNIIESLVSINFSLRNC